MQDLKEPLKREQGLAKLEKFERTNVGYDYSKHLEKESVGWAQAVKADLVTYKQRMTDPSTNHTGSLGHSSGLPTG